MTTRAIPQGIRLTVGRYNEMELTPDIFACVVQYPNASGNVEDYRSFVEKAHAAGCKVAVAADILSLALLTPPGEWGADIVFGSTQRLGTPMFYGGPSAAYLPHAMNTNATCLDVSSDGRVTNTVSYATAWPYRHANSTSSARRLHPIYALLKPCLPPWPDSMPYTMVRKASAT